MKINNLLPLNLQFFAEEEGADVNETAAVEQSEGEVETQAESEDAGTPEGDNTEETAEPQTFQTDKANAAFANMRRELEAAKRQQAELDRMYAQQFGGYKNPETGQPIRNAKDYMDAMAAQQRMQARQQLQQNNIDPSIIDNMIANSPVVRQAEHAISELNATKAQQQMDRDIETVLKLDPTLTSKEALLSDPSMPLVYDRVAQGMNLVDAYKLVNFDRLSSSRTAAAKQSVVNQVKGQAHLANGNAMTSTDGLDDIPASMIEDFKDMFPNKSAAELKALYNKTIKSRRN